MTPVNPHPSRAVVAAEIRAAMARAGIKQAALADAIGMSPPSLSERLNLRRPFNMDHLHAIADELDVDVFSLMAPPTTPGRVSA